MGTEAAALKSWCATCYEQPALRLLLGDALHPGGPAATVRLGRRLGLAPEMDVLDVACGPGLVACAFARVAPTETGTQLVSRLTRLGQWLTDGHFTPKVRKFATKDGRGMSRWSRKSGPSLAPRFYMQSVPEADG